MSGLRVTSARAWREKIQAIKSATELVMLPEDVVAELRRPDPVALLNGTTESGIPAPLRGKVMSIINNGMKSMPDVNDPDTILATLAVQDVMVIAAMANPRVVRGEANYDAGEISLDDLTFEQKSFIVSWALSAPGSEQHHAAATFPDGHLPGVRDVPGGEPLRDAPIGDPGDQ